MAGHHLVLGKTTDYLSGEEIEDNHDERYRQKMARFLVEEKKILKQEIISKIRMDLKSASGKKGYVRLDFCVRIGERCLMIVKYGPGSLTTRQTPAIAMSRLMENYQIPFVVVTNGEDALVLDGETGRLISSGMDSIPDRISLEKKLSAYYFPEITGTARIMAGRLAYAYEIDGACPCDENVCRLPSDKEDEDDERIY